MNPLFRLLLIALLLPTLHIKAQNYDDPGAYMKAMNNTQANFNKVYLSYISAAWHSTRAAKIEKLRQQVVDNLTACRYKIIDMPIYKHDNSLRQSNIDYLWLLTKIFNDDYSHLVNMEELIDQSFDDMELYLHFQEKINDTLKLANEKMEAAEKTFAEKYNVTLTSDKSVVSEKMDLSNKVSKYRNKVFLLFFKCAWQESQVMDALSKKNITKTEQARSALLKYSTEGLAAIDTLNSYENDVSLSSACKQSLTFYKNEAETELPKISDFLLKDEDFTKLKTAYDAKAKNDRTKQDTDSYNKAETDLDASLATANKAIKGIITDRNKTIINYSNVEQKFIDAHMPYYR